jgi:uncharacterized protein YmfQ (DUF2313 family)
MPVPQFLAADYAEKFKALLPSGRVWPKDDSSVLSSVSAALMPAYERNNDAAAFLLFDAFPGQSVQLLPEWESTLGLPDPCTGPLATIQQQDAAVLAKFVGTGGQSPDYFIAVAAALGWTITITEFLPFEADVGHAEDPLWDESGAYTWQVNAPLVTTYWFEADVSSADSPLASWGNLPLQCTLQRIAPAHTYLLFAYS